jgi:undecaprenyl diphosphate synthase
VRPASSPGAEPLPPPERWPRHIAIVMDGNGRWAERRHRPRTFGHRAGAAAVRRAVEFCVRHGIPALTLFAFSSENWQRPKQEVSALQRLLLRSIEREVDELHETGVRLRFIGGLEAFPAELVERMRESEARTQANRALTLNVALNYGGRWDLTQACRRLAERARAGVLDPAAITEDDVARELTLADLPEPDLFIRTGGECRISNFLLWQLAYSELHFSDVLWPDFGASQFELAVREFARRERRYGRTGAQVQSA